MSSFYEWDPAHYEFLLATLLTTICFSVYWFVSTNAGIKSWFFANTQEEKSWINYGFSE
jgi:hypothetical protein